MSSPCTVSRSFRTVAHSASTARRSSSSDATVAMWVWSAPSSRFRAPRAAGGRFQPPPPPPPRGLALIVHEPRAAPPPRPPPAARRRGAARARRPSVAASLPSKVHTSPDNVETVLRLRLDLTLELFRFQPPFFALLRHLVRRLNAARALSSFRMELNSVFVDSSSLPSFATRFSPRTPWPAPAPS